ncbi:protein D2-like [Eurosta solidaginis]|uniref:protein D2-like n=1 Tax=Eurosta solidaginis TaxID=178769 RepID=UPI003531009F
MFSLKQLLLLSLACLTNAADSDITKFMKHLNVIPDLIDEGPQEFLKITFVSGVMADKGVELTPTQVKSQPKVEWKPESADTYYTLLMTDPDAPSRTERVMREWHHWLVGNIPGDQLEKGEVLTEYVGSGPPKDTGLHRYIFLLYKQPNKLEFTETHFTNKMGKGREGFSTKNFVKKYGLSVPVAGNFFQAQFDDSVPELHKQLGY